MLVILLVRPDRHVRLEDHREGLSDGSGWRFRNPLRAGPGAGPHAPAGGSRWRCSSLRCCMLPLVRQTALVAVATSMLITAIVVVGLQINTGLRRADQPGPGRLHGRRRLYDRRCSRRSCRCPSGSRLPLGGLSAALFGLIFGLTAVRIKGFYLALTTIAAQFLFHFLVLNLPGRWLGGANGITIEPATLFGFGVRHRPSIYYLCLVVTLVMVGGRLRHRPQPPRARLRRGARRRRRVGNDGHRRRAHQGAGLPAWAPSTPAVGGGAVGLLRALRRRRPVHAASIRSGSSR